MSDTQLDGLQIEISKALSRETVTAVWRIVHKQLYLRPECRVVVDPQTLDVRGAAEEITTFLRAHSSMNMLVSVIRGNNMLSRLDEWRPASARVESEEWLSATAEFGAGPIATALIEGAQIVVASGFDPTAPFIAMGIHRGVYGWDDIGCLGALAAASQFEGSLVEVDGSNTVFLKDVADEQISQVIALGKIDHADVVCDYSAFKLRPSMGGRAELTGVGVTQANGDWLIRAIQRTGYRAALLIESDPHATELLRNFVDQAWTNVASTVYLSQPVNQPQRALLRLTYVAATYRLCQQFIDGVKSQVSQTAATRVAEPSPSIDPIIAEYSSAIPRDRVILSVDTRPAQEWL